MQPLARRGAGACVVVFQLAVSAALTGLTQSARRWAASA